MSISTDNLTAAKPAPALPDVTDLACLVAAKLCHDFISPSGAVMSGLDLLDDPMAQDMREDAMGLIRQSARKMISLVNFSRVAYGASSSAERFSSNELHTLLAGMIEGGRAQLDWRVPDISLSKPHARALINLAYITVGALPLGGIAVINARDEGETIAIGGSAEGNRARLKPEAIVGLNGEPLTDGLQGQWVQPYWLWLTISQAGGRLKVTTNEGHVTLVARLPKADTF